MSNNTQQNNNTKEEKKEEKMWGSLSDNAKMDWDPIKVPLQSQTQYLNSSVACGWISIKMRETFSDYMGCNLKIGQGNMLYLEMYFGRNSNNSKTNNLLPSIISVHDKKIEVNDIVAMKLRQKALMNNNIFSLNDETKLLLGEFIGGIKPDSKEWKKYIRVENTSSMMNVPNNYMAIKSGRIAENVEIVVTIPNIRYIFNKLLGYKFTIGTELDDNGNPYNVNSTAFRDIKILEFNKDGTFTMKIETFDHDNVASAYSERQIRNGFGIPNSTYSRVMY